MKTALEATTTTTAAQIAAALGANWKAEEANGGHSFLIREDGLKLWISSPSWSGDSKHHVSLSIPHNCPTLYDEKREQMTAGGIRVSPGKSAEKIAADIARRLLPRAEVVYCAAIKRMKLEEDARNARLAAMEAVAKASGGKALYEWGGPICGGAPDLTRPKFTVSVGGDSSLWDRHGYGEMRINQGLNPSVEITLNGVPLSVALQISEFLRDNVYKLSA